MSYFSAYTLSEDQDFFVRVGMCYQEQGSDFETGVQNRHAIASSPGFADAYESALVAEVPNPGRDQAVISDAQILSAVQSQP